MANTWVQQQIHDKGDLREFQRDYTITEATELIVSMMDRESVSRSELAHRLGKTKGHITYMLDGQANMTLATLSDVFTALGYTLHFGCVPLSFHLGVGPNCPGDDLLHWSGHNWSWEPQVSSDLAMYHVPHCPLSNFNVDLSA